MLSFRRPDLEEIPSFAKVHVQCWREAYRGIVPDTVLKNLSVEKRQKGWSDRLQEADVYVLGVFDDKRPIGFLHSGPTGNDAHIIADGQIYGIYLLEEFYRRGIGRRLFGYAARDWIVRGESMCVESLAGNIRASQFYKALDGIEFPGTAFRIEGHELPQVHHHFADLERLTRL